MYFFLKKKGSDLYQYDDAFLVENHHIKPLVTFIQTKLCMQNLNINV
jgi:hypothetical protein